MGLPSYRRFRPEVRSCEPSLDGLAVIVGYTTKDNTVFCAECWVRRQTESPDRVLDTESVEEPDDNFWIGDICATCGAKIRYREARFLG